MLKENENFFLANPSARLKIKVCLTGPKCIGKVAVNVDLIITSVLKITFFSLV